MEKAGPGAYYLGQVASGLMPCRACDIKLEAIFGTFDDPVKESAVIRVISFSRKYGGWCGVTWSQLSKSRGKERIKERSIREVIHKMIKGDLMIVCEQRKGWLSFLNYFHPQVVCPTRKLVRLVLAHQKGVKQLP